MSCGVLPKRGKSLDELGLDLLSQFLTRRTNKRTSLLHCSSFIVLFGVASTMLCYTALARQAAPAAGLKLSLLFLFFGGALLLGLFLSGAVLWCAGVPLVPLAHAVLGWCHDHAPEPDPCAFNTWPPPRDKQGWPKKHDEWPRIRLQSGRARRGYVWHRRRRHATRSCEDDAEVRATLVAQHQRAEKCRFIRSVAPLAPLSCILFSLPLLGTAHLPFRLVYVFVNVGLHV